ncbi:FG-GAP-like repeat-containing protein, partial [Rhodomicrobium lacus]|uniref:FG-GAP-like repeat-containing protein n=1 Tax=Rhodomicrobium lacus TaxID=2498452 RepID=UPI0013DED88C
PTTFTWATTETLPQGTNPFISQTGELPQEKYQSNCGVSVPTASADFNNDGRTDFLMVTSDCERRKISGRTDYLWFGQADGNFSKIDIGNAVPAGYRVMAQGSFGGKGGSDLYLASTDSYGRKNAGATDYVWLSNGDGTFQKLTVSSASAIPGGWIVAAAGNLRGNGLTDLFLFQADDKGRKEGSPTDRVLLADGDGSFGSVDLGTGASLPAKPSFEFSSDGSVYVEEKHIGYKTIAVGDFNGDNLADFYFSSAADDGVISPLFWIKLTFGLNGGTTLFSSAELLDKLYLSRGDGTFDIVDNPRIVGSDGVRSPTSAREGYKLAAASDLNGDGLTDLYLKDVSASSGKDRILLSKGDGTFEEVIRSGQKILSSGGDYANYDVFAAGDLTGSGKPSFHLHRPYAKNNYSQDHALWEFPADLTSVPQATTLNGYVVNGDESQYPISVGDFRGSGGLSEYIRVDRAGTAYSGYLLTSPPRLNYLVKSIENGLGNR